MKIVERDIPHFQEQEYFFPIRDKIDYARLLVLSARILLLSPSVYAFDAIESVEEKASGLVIGRQKGFKDKSERKKDVKPKGIKENRKEGLKGKQDDVKASDSSLKLVIDKMSRLFFYKTNKYFSVSFPFTAVVENNEVFSIATYTGRLVDFKSISAVISILDSEPFKLNPSLIDFPIEPGSIELLGVSLLEEIFQFEPSYIRYDNDPENQNGKLHPLNHLDINYSQYSTFKLGVPKAITKSFFEDLQNTNTDCSFLSM